MGDAALLHGPLEACLHPPVVQPSAALWVQHGGVKASMSQGAVLAQRCSLGAGRQPPHQTVAEGRTCPMGALTEVGNEERDLGVGDYVCLPRPYRSPSPQLLLSCGSPCWCNSSFFQPEPLRP